METFETLQDFSGECRGALYGGVVVIGNFDGLHLGHRQIIEAARDIAQREEKPLVVLTFEPHPKAFFQPTQPPFRLTLRTDKERILSEWGVGAVVHLPFDQELSEKTPEAFIEDILVKGLGGHHIVVGENFVFGHQRAGDVALLKQAATERSFELTAMTLSQDARAAYSSSRVRQHIREGEVAEAAKILGRPWQVQGTVVMNARRGREIGVPTANLELGSYLRPLYGVYAVRCQLEGELDVIDGIANVGVRPTMGGHREFLEAHLFDFKQTIYGRTLRVEFIDFIRQEQRFESFDQLAIQIREDMAKAREILQA